MQWHQEPLKTNLLSMDDVLGFIENTVKQSTIKDFRSFLSKYAQMMKWVLCSDYCFDDKNKPNDAISFVLYPYILDFTQWESIIDALQPSDIKNSRHLSERFMDFTHQVFFFSINFVFDKKGTFFDKWRNKEALVSLVNQVYQLDGCLEGEHTPDDQKV